MTDPAAHYRAQLLGAAGLALATPRRGEDDLATELYQRWFAPPTGEAVPALHPQGRLAHYRAADAASGRFEPGWTVAEADAGTASPWQIPATRGSEFRWVDPGDFLYPGATGLRPPAGAAIEVTARRDVEFDGWWSTLSAAWEPSGTVLRLYWSVRPAHVARLIETLTANLDFGAPWALKAPLLAERLQHPDAVVLYVAASAWEQLQPAIATSIRRSASSLRDEPPALTLVVAPGVGLAEDPGDESFGTQRCRVIAEGLAQALSRGADTPTELCRAAESALARHGISIAAPYVSSGSRSEYRLAAA
jgi:hypothetical protein